MHCITGGVQCCSQFDETSVMLFQGLFHIYIFNLVVWILYKHPKFSLLVRQEDLETIASHSDEAWEVPDFLKTMMKLGGRT